MDRENLRLECLKLTYTHGRNSAEAVDRALILEEYMLSSIQPSQVKTASQPMKRKAGRPRKVDNPNLLS